jgi:hypothetical protein
MTPTEARASAVAERIKMYLEWSGWYGTSPEPDKYDAPLCPSRSLDARNTIVHMIAAALREARAEGLEEAAQECLKLKYSQVHNSVEGLHDWIAERAHSTRTGEEQP